MIRQGRYSTRNRCNSAAWMRQFLKPRKRRMIVGGSLMANPKKRVPENVPGDFFVDSTCIDCDACRQIAPSVFAEAAETSFVKAQPPSSADRRHGSIDEEAPTS